MRENRGKDKQQGMPNERNYKGIYNENPNGA
jgi:hypothetical protein